MCNVTGLDEKDKALLTFHVHAPFLSCGNTPPTVDNLFQAFSIKKVLLVVKESAIVIDDVLIIFSLSIQKSWTLVICNFQKKIIFIFG